MIASTCLAVALVPVFFVQIQNMTLKRQSKREQQALSESVTEQPKE
jgi:hypothetical protein